MSYEIEGKLLSKSDVKDVTDKFRKRDFVIIKKETNNNQTFTDYIKFQLIQKNCGLVDSINIGDQIKVSFNIKGNKWEKEGKTSYFVNLDAWKVELVDEMTGNSEGNNSSKRINPLDTSIEEGTEEDFFGDSDMEDSNDDLPF